MGLFQAIKTGVKSAALYRTSRRPPERLAHLRETRLRKLLAKAAEAPFYRQLYAGLDLARCPLEQLPTVTKPQLLANFDEVLTDRSVNKADLLAFLSRPENLGKYYRGQYAVSHTSGSQGPPFPIVQDKAALELFFAIIGSRATRDGKTGLLYGLRRFFRPTRLAVISNGPGFYPSGSAFEFLQPIAGPFLIMTQLSAFDPALVDKLNEFQPTAISSYPSNLQALALQSDRFSFLSSLRQITSTGEELTETAHARIRKAFGVPIFNHYGSGECLFMAEGCPTDGGAHVNADWAILEVVDRNHRPVRTGELGDKVLVTNLANGVQPIIRYEIGDRLAWADRPCSCGNRLPRLSRIEGRSADIIWVPHERGQKAITGVAFQNALDSFHWLREWQVVQTSENSITLRIEPLPDTDPQEKGITDLLSGQIKIPGIPDSLDLKVAIVPSLMPDKKTGKFKRLIGAEYARCP